MIGRWLWLIGLLPQLLAGQDLRAIAQLPDPQARIVQLTAAIQRQPSAEAHYYRALAYLEAQEATKAEADIAAAKRLGLSPSSLTLTLRSWLALLRREHMLGLQLAQQALASQPTDQLAATLVQRHRQAIAQQQDRALSDPSISPTVADASTLLEAAGRQAAQGQYQLAADLITRALPLLRDQLQHRPQQAGVLKRQLYDAYRQRAEIHWFMGDLNRTLSDLTSAISLLPFRPEAHERLGQLQVSRGNWPQAIRAYEQLYRQVPAHPTGWVNLGYAYSRQGDRAAVLRTYGRALALPHVADRAQLLNNRGSLHLSQGNWAAAEQDLQASIAADPELAVAHVSLGELHLARQDWLAATAAFDRVLTLPSADTTDRYLAFFHRAAAHAGAIRVAAAEQDLRAALQLDPGVADAYEALAMLLESQDRHCEALRLLEQGTRRQRRYGAEDPQIPRLLARLQGLGLRCP